jgi:hypothetical protein
MEQMSFAAPSFDLPDELQIDYGAVIEEIEEYSTEA